MVIDASSASPAPPRAPAVAPVAAAALDRGTSWNVTGATMRGSDPTFPRNAASAWYPPATRTL
jgi:hypothetical protein